MFLYHDDVQFAVDRGSLAEHVGTYAAAVAVLKDRHRFAVRPLKQSVELLWCFDK